MLCLASFNVKFYQSPKTSEKSDINYSMNCTISGSQIAAVSEITEHKRKIKRIKTEWSFYLSFFAPLLLSWSPTKECMMNIEPIQESQLKDHTYKTTKLFPRFTAS